MIENVGRKVFWIVVFLLAALSCLLVPEKPFRMGLDLQGGTRLVYRFDFDEAAAQGKISEAELLNKAQLLQDFCAIIRERVDPTGVTEPIIRPSGLSTRCISSKVFWGKRKCSITSENTTTSN